MKIYRLFFILYFCFGHHVYAQKETLLEFNSSLPNNEEWWELFGDQTLYQLIHQSISYNYNIQMAMKNIEIARTKMRIEQSHFFPSVTTNANYTPEKSSKGIDQSNSYHRIGEVNIDMSWELDVFGNIRKNVKSQKQYYFIAQEDYRGVMVSLAAEIAQAYIQLRTYQKQWDVAQHNLESQKEILHLNEVKSQTGLGSQLAVAQSRSLWLETKATLPEIESSIHEQVNTLLTLVGKFSDSLSQQLLHPQGLPKIKAIAIKSIPIEFIRQRPDVRSAEKKIDALAAAVGASRSEWWPKFYFNATIGYGNTYFKQFFQKENMTWQIAPSIQWNLFSGRQATENNRLTRLELDEGIESYNQILLTALQETNQALIAYNKSIEQLEATRKAFEQIRLTLQYAIDLYNRGLTDYQSVLDSQRNVFNYENTLVTAESNHLLYFIQLYKALGGGFQYTTQSE